MKIRSCEKHFVRTRYKKEEEASPPTRAMTSRNNSARSVSLPAINQHSCEITPGVFRPRCMGMKRQNVNTSFPLQMLKKTVTKKEASSERAGKKHLGGWGGGGD